MALIEVRLRPTTPWRVGHGAGDRERVDVVYHSDALYSAITHAMKTLGWLDEWLAATAGIETVPAVRFSSLFPFIGKTRLVAPPKTWWPPANPGRLYTEAAKLIPLEVVRNGIVDESRWMVDGETGCLFHTGSGAPLKIVVRTAAAIDRLTGVADPHRIACLEFAPNAGWWGVFAVDDAVWESRVKSAFRLLADSGFGGERSRGWGRAAAPEFSDASSLLPTKTNDEGAWWLLSVYSPHTDDAVDWSRGEYSAAVRGGWTDSQSGVALKKQVRVIEEGSVLYAAVLRGRAVDVAPDGFPHPVYRAGFAFAVPAPAEPVLRQHQAPPIAGPAPTPESGVIAEIEAEAEVVSEGAPPPPDGCDQPIHAEVPIPAEFEKGIHHEPEPCDQPIHTEVTIPAEFEKGVHHEPEPCDQPIHAEVPIPAEFEKGVHHKPEPCDQPIHAEVPIPAEFEKGIHHHPEPCDQPIHAEVPIPAEFEKGVHHEPEPCDQPIHAEVPIPAEFEKGVHHEPEPCDEPIHAEVPIPAEFEKGIHHHPEPCDQPIHAEVPIPAEFEKGVHHEPEPCDQPIHAEVPIPAEFEKGIHHHPEPCDQPIHAEVPIPAEFEKGVHHEPEPEVVAEIEAEAEMVFEGAPPEPQVKAESVPVNDDPGLEQEADAMGESKPEPEEQS